MGPNQLLAETYDEYIKRLRDLDVAEIASGEFGVIFQHPTMKDVAVKIVKADDAYMQYVAFCRKNKGNPWLPEIIDVNESTLDDKRIDIVFMKVLKPATDKDVVLGFQTLAPGADLKRFSEQTRLSYPEWMQAVRFAKGIDERQLCVFMAKHFNRLDLYTRNFMMRGTQLVFNDPLSPS